MADNNQSKIEEKKHHEKHVSDPLSRITGGLILILLGVLFLLSTMDYIPWGMWWPYLLLGLGIIFILEVVLRAVMRVYYRPITGKLIGGVVLIIIGAANTFGMVSWWPLILIAVGIIIIFSSLRKTTAKKE